MLWRVGMTPKRETVELDPECPENRPIPVNPDVLIYPSEAAFLLGLSKRTLEALRLKGEGPAYVALGRRSVRYQRKDINAYVEARRSSQLS